ncbi:MAG: hypothetical protein AB7O59_21395 [Pirellulales bacterium]
MEDDVYQCGWAESADGFELWVRAHQDIRARGRSLQEAEEALVHEIASKRGVYHATLEYVPQLPKLAADSKYSFPELYGLAGDERFETDEPRRVPFETEDERRRRDSWRDQFFLAPCCRECGTPRGPRNEHPLRLTHVRTDYDGGFALLAGAFLHVFSERFLAQLTDDERRLLQFRPIKASQKLRHPFFELAGPPGLPTVALAGRTVTGWRCDACGARVFGYDHSADTDIGLYVARRDLPTPVPTIFTIGSRTGISLGVTADRWRALAEQPGTRGIVSRPLGALPDNQVVRVPELGPRSDRS